MHYTRGVRAVLVVCALGGSVSGCLCTPAPGPGGDHDADVDAEIDARPPCADGDGDGWTTGCVGIPDAELDCNDGDALHHPGAFESPTTGDRDCVPGFPSALEAFPDLTVTPFGTGARVATRFGRFDLAPSSGHQLGSVRVYGTDSLLSAELLFEGAPNMREKFSGVHVWNDYFSVEPDGSALAPATPTADGPVVYRAVVTYHEDGPNAEPALSGTAHYTFTIDGRIIRTDDFDLAQQAIYVAQGTDLPGLTSHIALAARASNGDAQLDTVAVLETDTVRTEAVPTMMPGYHFDDGNPINFRWLCAQGPQVEVGFAAIVSNPPAQPRRSLRATTNVSNNPVYRQVALQWDWEVSSPANGLLMLGAHLGHFLILPHARSAATCDLVDRQARAYLTPVDVVFAGSSGSLRTDGDYDDNDDGYVEGGGYWYLRAAAPDGIAFSFEQAADTYLPPHSLFRIANVPADRDPIVNVGGVRMVHGQHYRIQADGTDGIWLAMLRGLQPADVVELVYPASCTETCP